MITPNFHTALVQVLKSEAPLVKVAVLQGLYDRQALDLDIVNEEGRNLLEALCQTEPLCQEVIEFIDAIGRTDLYANPHNGKWALMDQQIKWCQSYSSSWEKRSQTLAKMIDRVQEQYWASYDQDNSDNGSSLTRKLSKLGEHAAAPLTSLWQRGVDPHARMANSEMAICPISTNDALNAYLYAGGNLEELTYLDTLYPNTYPVWRHLYDRTGGLYPSLQKEAAKGNISVEMLKFDEYGKHVKDARGNQAEMTKRIIQHSNWNTVKQYNGTPFWLYTLSLRSDLLDNYLERKRKRPDFSEKDPFGRSVWFWANIQGFQQNPSLVDALRQELSDDFSVLNNKEEGLYVQILKHWINKLSEHNHYDGIAPSHLSQEQIWNKVETLPIASMYRKSLEFYNEHGYATNNNQKNNLHAAWLLSLAVSNAPLDQLGAEQRGMLASTLLLHTNIIGEFGRYIQKKGLYALHLLTHDNIIWPDCPSELVEKRKTITHPFDMKSIGNYLNQWESLVEKQNLEQSTIVPMKSSLSRPRL